MIGLSNFFEIVLVFKISWVRCATARIRACAFKSVRMYSCHPSVGAEFILSARMPLSSWILLLNINCEGATCVDECGVALWIRCTSGSTRDQFCLISLSKIIARRCLMTSLLTLSTIPFSSCE